MIQINNNPFLKVNVRGGCLETLRYFETQFKVRCCAIQNIFARNTIWCLYYCTLSPHTSHPTFFTHKFSSTKGNCGRLTLGAFSTESVIQKDFPTKMNQISLLTNRYKTTSDTTKNVIFTHEIYKNYNQYYFGKLSPCVEKKAKVQNWDHCIPVSVYVWG